MKNLDEYDRLWKLLRVAVNDLILCEQNPQYVIDMDHWVLPGGGTCAVCLAGSVMVQTAAVSNEDMARGIFSVCRFSDKCKYFALDEARNDDIEAALCSFYDLDGDYEDMSPGEEREARALLSRIEDGAKRLPIVPPYEDNPAGFKQSITQISAELEKLDL